MIYIYVLKLEDNKYYIGKTHNPKFRLDSHFKYQGSEWTKKYNPINLVELNEGDNFDEDKYTLKYMSEYGIQNVRGGSWCQIKLSQNDKDRAMKSIKGATDKCFECGQKGHFISNCPFITYHSSDEVVWCCKYCDKEFDTEKGCLFHENIYCKQRIKKTNKKTSKNTCNRCGRKGHYESNCYAKTDINGYLLLDESSDESSDDY